MARSNSTISVLQFDERSVRLARFSPGPGGGLCEKAAVAATGDSAALRDFFSGAAEPEGIAVIPRHQATVRFLTLPSQDPAELTSMVALASEELAPYPREQVTVQHQCLQTLDSGESRVMVVLVHNAVIQQQVESLSAIGVEPAHLYLSTTCLHALASAAPEAPSDRFVLACVYEDALEVLVMQHGVLEFSRGVAHHAPWNLDLESGRDALGYEVRDSLAAWRRESEGADEVNHRFVFGEGHEASDLAETLSQVTGKAWQPARFMERPDGNGPSPTAVARGAVCSAARAVPLAIDFLPPSLARTRSIRETLTGLRRAVALLALVSGLTIAAFGQSVYQRLSLIQELRLQVESIAPGADDIALRQRGLQAIARQLDDAGSFLSLLAAVAEAAPEEGLNITRIEYDREGGMNVWGRAQTKDLVLGDFLGRLRQRGEGALAQLAEAHSQYETAGQERGQNIVNYQIAIPALSEVGADDAPAPAR